jgi:GNAT superfamily N-acetyltransferase
VELVLQNSIVTFNGRVTLIIEDKLGSLELNGECIDDKLWKLAGAFDGSTLQVTLEEKIDSVWGPIDAIVLTVTHELLLERPMVRKILAISENGKDMFVMENVEFFLKPQYQQKGIGRACLSVEAETANSLQFFQILANAASHPHVGWKVWPKLGYDAKIDDDIIKKMHTDPIFGRFVANGEDRISNLWDQGLFDLWETYGDGCMMEFDVASATSWSMRRLASASNGKE